MNWNKSRLTLASENPLQQQIAEGEAGIRMKAGWGEGMGAGWQVQLSAAHRNEGPTSGISLEVKTPDFCEFFPLLNLKK
jgi:hypothetical protein